MAKRLDRLEQLLEEEYKDEKRRVRLTIEIWVVIGVGALLLVLSNFLR